MCVFYFKFITMPKVPVKCFETRSVIRCVDAVSSETGSNGGTYRMAPPHLPSTAICTCPRVSGFDPFSETCLMRVTLVQK